MRRTTSLLVSMFGLIALLAVTSLAVTADEPQPPAPPSNLTMSLHQSGVAVSTGSWISATKLDISFDVQVTGPALIPQVEMRPSDVAFTDHSNFAGPLTTASGTVTVPVVDLRNGKSYHWQARVVDESGLASTWVPFSPAGSTDPDFSVDLNSPSRPVISSRSDPNQNHWYHNQVVHLRWSAHDATSGIRGYTYAVERKVHVIPPGAVTSQTSLQLPHLGNGTWFLALRAVDNAGNWSPTATFQIQIDRVPPHITWLSPNHFTFNPYEGPTTVHFRANKDARVKLALYRVGSKQPTRVYTFAHLQAGQVATITWSGKDAHGRPVSRGYYFFSVRAIDHANNFAHWNLGGIVVNPQQPHLSATGQPLFPDGGKRIIVSLSRQTLYAYDGTKLVQQTLVTTGNPSLPTPPGHYTILARYHPFQFVSPWPEGSPYYYPPSWVQYAMLFRQGGYFLHDAPWRGVFGPGSNGPGQPGTNYGGTHGCVNIPPGPTYFLWNWAPLGTPVDVVP